MQAQIDAHLGKVENQMSRIKDSVADFQGLWGLLTQVVFVKCITPISEIG